MGFFVTARWCPIRDASFFSYGWVIKCVKVRESIRIRVAQDNTVMATPVCVFRVSPVMQTDGNASGEKAIAGVVTLGMQVDVNTTQLQ